MSERPDDLDDDLLRTRLGSALGDAPARVTSRLQFLAAAGMRTSRPVVRATPLWLEVGVRSAGTALALVMVAAALGVFPGLFTGPQPVGGEWPAVAAALRSLVLPIGMLVGAELLRGAPTVRRLVG